MKKRKLMLSVLFVVVLFAGNLMADTFDFNNTNDLTTYFNGDSTPTFTNISEGGLFNSGSVFCENKDDIWTDKTEYQPVDVDSNYVISAYYYNYQNSGYGNLGIAISSINDCDGLGSPDNSIGMCFHGGGGYFMNCVDANHSQYSVNWDSGDMTLGQWYKMILTITFKGSNTYDIDFKIYESDASGILGALHTENTLTGIINENVGGATGIYAYFAATDYRFQYIDNFECSMTSGGTLPVELSSFTAIQTESNLAQLNWVTQSETDLLGYNVYRNISDEENSRVKINSVIIAAENSSNENNYTFTDKNVEMSNTYYYWLESVDLDGSSQFFGPVNITFGSDDPQNPDAPEIPINPGIQKIYPNPFNPQTTISYYLDKDTDVTIKIYNAKGQKVNEFNQGVQKGQTMHSLVWSGKNSNSENVSSGVYFFRLNAGKIHQIKKAILLK